MKVNITGIGNGAPNTAGIPIVFATGAIADGNFALSGGPVNAGFFAYDLFRNGQDFDLRAVGVGNAAYEMPAGTTGAQSVGMDSTAELQQQAADSIDAPSGVNTWMQAFGNRSALDPKLTFTDGSSGRTETLDLDSSKRLSGFLTGADVDVGNYADGKVRVGVSAGYLNSVLDFAATPDDWTYRGLTLGAYGSYLRDGFYLTGLVKADLLDVSINDQQGTVNSSAETSATTVGAAVQTGYHVMTGWGFIEPQASLDLEHTSLGDVDMLGGNVAFADGTGGRLRGGVKIGTTATMNDLTVTPDATFNVWNQFGTDNSATMSGIPGVSSFTVSNNSGSSLFGNVSAGLTLANSDAWSGSMRASYTFSSDSSGGSISAGLHHTW